MKPTTIEWIPFFGMFKYFRRYFKGIKRDDKDVLFALRFEMYHFVASFIVFLLCLVLL